jgi:type IV secretion system protein VirB10
MNATPETRDPSDAPRGGPTASEAPGDFEPGTVAGERSAATVNRVRSLQSRLSNVLAAALMCALGLGALSWYYAHMLTRRSQALAVARRASRAQVSGDAPLPALGTFRVPTMAAPSARVPASPAPNLAAEVLGPPPPLPSGAAQPPWSEADALNRFSSGRANPYGAHPNARVSAWGEKLGGAVFAQSSGGESAPSAPAPSAGGSAPPWVGPAPVRAGPAAGGGGDSLSSLLTPSVTPAVEASVLPDLKFLLPKGAFIDCTLETAIDSTLPGMTTCVTATDTLSADGTVVLLERGTKLVGETRGEVHQGQARVFVLWTEARTPTGVIVPLNSPGTDSLGRSGLRGHVNTHFWARFGAAILVSVIDAGVQAGVQATSNGGAVIVNPSASEDVMTGILRSTVDIPPTVTVRQGARIQVLVARDVDFRSVYRLALTQPVSSKGSSR